MDFETIYRFYFKDVFLYLCALTGNEVLAEEITQETFWKALKKISQFDGSKDIRAWLFTIAKHTYFTHYKKQKHLIMQEDILQNTVTEGPSLLQGLIQEESAFLIHRFLHTMAEPYKEVFHLRVFGELPYEKIGLLFGKSANWARVTFYRAKKQVIEYMEAMQDEKSQL